MRVCQIVPSLESQYGGPSRSVLQLSMALAEHGATVDLLTTHPKPAPTPQTGHLGIHTFLRNRPQRLCISRGLARHLAGNDYDIVHHHSLWLRTLHYAHRFSAPRVRRPLIISPRGMMSPWAWQHNRWRKQFAQDWVHPSAMEQAAGWHATSSTEADDIRRLGFTQPVCVAPNSVTRPGDDEIHAARAKWESLCPEVKQRRVAVFYSRFHRKKRLLELMDLWLQVAPPEWLLLVAGIPEEYSVAALDNYLEKQPKSKGLIRIFSGDSLPPPYAVGSLFLLPSHSENYGMVIAEAMAHGLPVAVTDTTPWQLLNQLECGWCVPWAQYPQVLGLILHTADEELKQKGQAAMQWVLKEHSWQKSAGSLLDFYRELQHDKS